MVIGPPLAIWRLNNGITDPLLPRTFPKRVAEKLVTSLVLLCTIISHIRFVAPMTLVGLTALSVLTMMNRFTPYFSQASTTFKVPNTLFLTDSITFRSINGTCLCAAAWRTMSGVCSLKILSTWPLSHMLAISILRFSPSPYLILSSCWTSYAPFS